MNFTTNFCHNTHYFQVVTFTTFVVTFITLVVILTTQYSEGHYMVVMVTTKLVTNVTTQEQLGLLSSNYPPIISWINSMRGAANCIPVLINAMFEQNHRFLNTTFYYQKTMPNFYQIYICDWIWENWSYCPCQQVRFFTKNTKLHK